MRAIVIGRHTLLKGQINSLKKIGVTEIINVLSIPEDRQDLEKIVNEWIKNKVHYVIVQALPLKTLRTLWNICNDKGLIVLVARMESIALVETEQEAKSITSKSPSTRTYIKGVQDKAYRVIEFKCWEKLKKLEVDLEPID